MRTIIGSLLVVVNMAEDSNLMLRRLVDSGMKVWQLPQEVEDGEVADVVSYRFLIEFPDVFKHSLFGSVTELIPDKGYEKVFAEVVEERCFRNMPWLMYNIRDWWLRFGTDEVAAAVDELWHSIFNEDFPFEENHFIEFVRGVQKAHPEFNQKCVVYHTSRGQRRQTTKVLELATRNHVTSDFASETMIYTVPEENELEEKAEQADDEGGSLEEKSRKRKSTSASKSQFAKLKKSFRNDRIERLGEVADMEERMTELESELRGVKQWMELVDMLKSSVNMFQGAQVAKLKLFEQNQSRFDELLKKIDRCSQDQSEDMENCEARLRELKSDLKEETHKNKCYETLRSKENTILIARLEKLERIMKCRSKLQENSDTLIPDVGGSVVNGAVTFTK